MLDLSSVRMICVHLTGFFDVLDTGFFIMI